MKFKAVTNAESPLHFQSALDGLRDRLEKEIANECFQVPIGSLGPAELYVQQTDLAGFQKPMVNYNASGITIKPGRDFDLAKQRLRSIIFEMIAEYWPDAAWVQVMVVIHASSADGEKSQLFESVSMYQKQ